MIPSLGPISRMGYFMAETPKTRILTLNFQVALIHLLHLHCLLLTGWYYNVWQNSREGWWHPLRSSLATIHICDDFNIHDKEWLVYWKMTDKEWKYCYDFSIGYKLSQIIDKPTCVPDTTEHHAKPLDLFLPSCTDQCSSEVLPPLVTLDHSFIYVSCWCKTKGIHSYVIS